MRRSSPAFHTLRSCLHGSALPRLLACQSGVAMVEFAVALPVLGLRLQELLTSLESQERANSGLVKTS